MPFCSSCSLSLESWSESAASDIGGGRGGAGYLDGGRGGAMDVMLRLGSVRLILAHCT